MEANLDQVAEELYGKIQTRFPDIQIADEKAEVLSKKEDIPKARFFEFEYTEGGQPLGTIAISLDDDDGIVIKASGDLVDEDDPNERHHGAYKFIRSFRQFARSHMLNFEVDNMGKSNLDKRDYEFHAKSGEEPMMESKMWGTTKVSYQDLGETRLIVKHSQPVNTDLAAGRTMHIDSIYIENSQGERFRYPVRHLNGARAMAQHIGHGGNPYDEIGQHVVSLSEELAKLRMFKGYVSRTPMVAEAMSTVNDKVIERIDQIKKELHHLQRPAYYEEFAESFAPTESREIPEEIMNDWVDRLTVRTFNEALKDVFPYIYKIVDESDIPVKEIDPDELLSEKKTEYCDACDRPEHMCVCDDHEKEVKEFVEFENFMDSLLGEGDGDVMSGHPEAIQGLKDEIAKGPLQGDFNQDGILKTFIKDPELHDILDKVSPNDDAWPIVKAWMDKKNPDVAKQVFGDEESSGSSEATPPEAEATPPEAEATPPEAAAPEATPPEEAAPPEAAAPVSEAAPQYTPDEIVQILSGQKTQAQVDAEKKAKATQQPAQPAVPAKEETDNNPPWDTDDSHSNFKKPHNPNRTGIDSARSLAQRGLAKAIKSAVAKGASAKTKVGDKTLHDMMLEAGLTYEECGLPPQDGDKPMAPPSEPAGSSLDDMKKFASGWWNKAERNFTIGGEGVKTKLIKQFRGQADDGELEAMLMFVDKLDPSSAEHKKGRMLALAGVKKHDNDLEHARRVMESYLGE